MLLNDWKTAVLCKLLFSVGTYPGAIINVKKEAGGVAAPSIVTIQGQQPTPSPMVVTSIPVSYNKVSNLTRQLLTREKNQYWVLSIKRVLVILVKESEPALKILSTMFCILMYQYKHVYVFVSWTECYFYCLSLCSNNMYQKAIWRIM